MQSNKYLANYKSLVYMSLTSQFVNIQFCFSFQHYYEFYDVMIDSIENKHIVVKFC